MLNCTKCGKEKDENFFVKVKDKKRGFTSHCKECMNERNRLYYAQNKEKIRQKHKEYYTSDLEREKKRAAKYYRQNKEKITAKHKIYRENNREQENERQKNWRLENRERVNQIIKKCRQKQQYNKKYRHAHQVVRDAIKLGIIQKPEHCSECNGKNRIQGHHEDYMKPLDVIWLCVKCHARLHRKKRNQEKL